MGWQRFLRAMCCKYVFYMLRMRVTQLPYHTGIYTAWVPNDVIDSQHLPYINVLFSHFPFFSTIATTINNQCNKHLSATTNTQSKSNIIQSRNLEYSTHSNLALTTKNKQPSTQISKPNTQLQASLTCLRTSPCVCGSKDISNATTQLLQKMRYIRNVIW